jgi:hypothetical protein
MKNITTLLVALLLFSSAFAQLGSRYTRTQTTGTYTAITGGTALPFPNFDDGVVRDRLPFTIRFNGTNYDTINICTNGFVNFGIASTSTASANLFNTSPTNLVVAPWWDDLLLTDSARVGTLGTAPNRVWVVQYPNVRDYYNNTVTGALQLNFQIRFYETTNVIEFWYGPKVGTVASTNSEASVGMKGATGGSGDFIDGISGSTTTGVSTRTSATDFPAAGTIIRFTPSTSSVSQVSNAAPKSFALSQNYPNPFNPSTSINYQLQTASAVRLEVFDMLGRNVGVLVNQAQPAGSYTANFNASQLASGIYMYRLQAGSFVETRKMMLVK